MLIAFLTCKIFTKIQKNIIIYFNCKKITSNQFYQIVKEGSFMFSAGIQIIQITVLTTK